MPKERNKADGYREKAYEGDTKAMNNLGVCYERGTGVKVSLELAFEWYMKAASKRGQSQTRLSYAERKQARPKVKWKAKQVSGAYPKLPC